jgi:glycosyltransferase involved in cell wall biosynthesis
MSYAPFNTLALPITEKVLTRVQRNGHAHSQSRARGTADQRNNYPLIVHSHLCWDWVWQRPQQFLSRLSHRHPVLFIETHCPDQALVSPLGQIRYFEKWPNLTLLRLQFPAWRWHDSEWVDRERRRLVKEALRGPLRGRFRNPVQWFYDPMAVTAFAGQLGERAIVYDCMDELSQFKGAPPEIRKREAQLLVNADVVFTGGRKMWESKSKHNPNCHFYGCGVDLPHFSRARSPQTAVPDDIGNLPKPVLGYFGVVDERMDYELVRKLAEANPNGSVVIIGPATKVDEKTLPRRDNIHWLGGREYSTLPAYCKGMDVCLMPFALNEATEYINPTKALEYMATGRMIVSTPVSDVVRNFGSVVKIANSHDEFITLCREAALDPDPTTIEKGLEMAASNSWESIIEKMEGHIADVLAKK